MARIEAVRWEMSKVKEWVDGVWTMMTVGKEEQTKKITDVKEEVTKKIK